MTHDSEKLLALAGRVERGEIRALSILQPWPHRIFHEGKDVENRRWPTKGRGWFLIHAGKSTREDPETIRSRNLPLGGIVGMARIVDCVEAMDSRWFYGPFGFVLHDAFPLPLAPCAGKLSFFLPPPETLIQVAAAIRERAGQIGGAP